MDTIKTTYKSINLPLLKEQARAQFAARFIDCNQTDYGQKLTVYLTDAEAGDQAAWDSLVTAHTASALTAGQQETADKGVDFAALRADVASALAFFQGNYDGWAGLTAGQKDTNSKNLTLSVIQILKALKYLAK